jgi:Dyp-type peroxidase family
MTIEAAPGRIEAAPEAAKRLATHEIQAHVLAGFAAPLQAAAFLELTELRAAKRWLRRVAAQVTPLSAGVRRSGLAAAFTFEGLRKLADDAERFRETAFKEGLHERSPLLGDPRGTHEPGDPRNWVVGGPGRVPDVFLLVAGGRAAELEAALARVTPRSDDGVRLMCVQEGAVLRGPFGRHEHFGFRDPVSQPGVRGFTEHALPGQRLIWPGEFVFGYPGQSAMDVDLPGPVTSAGPEWGRDGSFLVVRRLRQDVASFRRFLDAAATRLGISPELAAAKCFGRWPSGAPLVLAPACDDSALGRDDSRNNDFMFGPDRAGLVCPQAAHIRKAYLRDQPTSDHVAPGVETHRLMRRSIPYGPPYPRPGDRGLLFLAYQTSLERQFEFVTRAWLNNPILREEQEGHDPVAGQNGRHPNRLRRFAVPVQDADGRVRRVQLALDEEWVVPTGGGYFFAPSLSALRLLAG